MTSQQGSSTPRNGIRHSASSETIIRGELSISASEDSLTGHNIGFLASQIDLTSPVKDDSLTRIDFSIQFSRSKRDASSPDMDARGGNPNRNAQVSSETNKKNDKEKLKNIVLKNPRPSGAFGSRATSTKEQNPPPTVASELAERRYTLNKVKVLPSIKTAACGKMTIPRNNIVDNRRQDSEPLNCTYTKTANAGGAAAAVKASSKASAPAPHPPKIIPTKCLARPADRAVKNPTAGEPDTKSKYTGIPIPKAAHTVPLKYLPRRQERVGNNVNKPAVGEPVMNVKQSTLHKQPNKTISAPIIKPREDPRVINIRDRHLATGNLPQPIVVSKTRASEDRGTANREKLAVGAGIQAQPSVRAKTRPVNLNPAPQPSVRAKTRSAHPIPAPHLHSSNVTKRDVPSTSAATSTQHGARPKIPRSTAIPSSESHHQNPNLHTKVSRVVSPKKTGISRRNSSWLYDFSTSEEHGAVGGESPPPSPLVSPAIISPTKEDPGKCNPREKRQVGQHSSTRPLTTQEKEENRAKVISLRINEVLKSRKPPSTASSSRTSGYPPQEDLPPRTGTPLQDVDILTYQGRLTIQNLLDDFNRRNSSPASTVSSSASNATSGVSSARTHIRHGTASSRLDDVRFPEHNALRTIPESSAATGRSTDLWSPPDATAVSATIRQRFHAKSKTLIPNGLKEVLKKTVEYTYQDNVGNKYQMCSICLDNFLQWQGVRRLPCMHLFHSACIDAWIIRKPSCPNCLREI